MTSHTYPNSYMFFQVYQALLSVPPTSCEAERCCGFLILKIKIQFVQFFLSAFRCFSAIGLYITKLRTRMSCGTIDDLFVLRGHFAPFAEERKRERMSQRKKYTKKKKAAQLSRLSTLILTSKSSSKVSRSTRMLSSETSSVNETLSLGVLSIFTQGIQSSGLLR